MRRWCACSRSRAASSSAGPRVLDLCQRDPDRAAARLERRDCGRDAVAVSFRGGARDAEYACHGWQGRLWVYDYFPPFCFCF